MVDPTIRRLASQLGDLLDDEMTRRLPALAEDAPQDLLVLLGMFLGAQNVDTAAAFRIAKEARGHLLARYEAKA